MRETELIRQAWNESGKVYGVRKLTDDLRDQGELISESRVARLASLAGIAAQVGYKRRALVGVMHRDAAIGLSPLDGHESGPQGENRDHTRLRRPSHAARTRSDARRDVFEYIELFYNPKRKHTNDGILSPVDFEITQHKMKQAGV